MSEVISQGFVVVLGMSVTASVVILTVLAARLCLRRMPSSYSYALWAAVGLRLICPVSLSAPFGLINGRPVPWDLAYMAQPRVDLGISGLNAAVNGSLPAATPYASANPMQIYLFMAALVWTVGLAVGLGTALIGYGRLRWRLRGAAILEPGVYESERVGTPFVLGLFRPRVYLPTGMAESDRRLVLIHERAHIARGDPWVSLIGWVLRWVHWFNPLVWLAYNRMRRDMEISCDELVARRMDRQARCDYAEGLVRAAGRQGFSGGLAFAEPPIGDRVRRVLHAKRPARWVAICVGAALAALIIFLLINAPSDRSMRSFALTGAVPAGSATMEIPTPCHPAGIGLLRQI